MEACRKASQLVHTNHPSWQREKKPSILLQPEHFSAYKLRKPQHHSPMMAKLTYFYFDLQHYLLSVWLRLGAYKWSANVLSWIFSLKSARTRLVEAFLAYSCTWEQCSTSQAYPTAHAIDLFKVSNCECSQKSNRSSRASCLRGGPLPRTKSIPRDQTGATSLTPTPGKLVPQKEDADFFLRFYILHLTTLP